jgi:hypothetical protein
MRSLRPWHTLMAARIPSAVPCVTARGVVSTEADGRRAGASAPANCSVGLRGVEASVLNRDGYLVKGLQPFFEYSGSENPLASIS